MITNPPKLQAGPELGAVTGSARLPQEIRDRIYLLCCACKCRTEKAAQREPCGCTAFALVEQIEDWIDDILPNESSSATGGAQPASRP